MRCSDRSSSAADDDAKPAMDAGSHLVGDVSGECPVEPGGGTSYGSAIDTSFAQVWQGAMCAKLRGELPAIRPKLCDPFKNRADTMLALGKTITAERGLDHLERDVADLVEARTYDPVRGRHRNR